MQPINNSSSVCIIVKYNSHIESWMSTTVDYMQQMDLFTDVTQYQRFFVFKWTVKKKHLGVHSFYKEMYAWGQVWYPGVRFFVKKIGKLRVP